MADGWHEPEGSNKRVYEQFLEGDEMRDLFNMSPPAKQTHCEVAAEVAVSGTNELSFDEYFSLLEDPAMRGVLELLPPPGASHQINDFPAAEEVPQLGDDGNLGKSVPHTQTWSDSFSDPQKQLNLQQPQGTLLENFFQFTPASQGPINFDNIFAGGGKLIPSADGMADSQPDLIEFDDPFRLPELHVSPLPDDNNDFMEVAPQLEDTKKQLTQASGPRKRKKPPGWKMGKISQIPGFPTSSEPLPPDLSLEEICRSWPNHLNGYYLEPFIEAGWGGKKIWNSMPEAAQAGPKDQPWNKMTKRLMHTKRQMELEGRGKVGVGLTPEAIWNNLVGEVSEDAAEQTVAVNTHGIAETTLHDPQPVQVQKIASSQYSQSEPNDPFEDLRRAFRAELDEQYAIITLILAQQDADWLLISLEEGTSRAMQTWMGKAHEYEAQLVRENFVDDEDMAFDLVSQDDMLKHLGELISKVHLASNPPRLAANEKEEEGFRQSHKLLVMEKELAILKAWTCTWKQQLEQLDANSYLEAVGGAAAESSGGNQEQGEQLFDEMLSFDSSSVATNQHTPATEAGFPSYSEQMSLPQTFIDQSWTESAIASYWNQTSMPQAFLDQSQKQDSCLGFDEQARISQISLDWSQTQTTADSTQNPVAGTSSTNQVKGGRKKLRMFPHAPPKDVVLSEQDLVDLDHILENFPEHLALPHVMVHYLGPISHKQGSHKGAYPTTAMVKKLLHHHNGKHGSDMNDPERSKGIYDWVMTQKDAARKFRRGDLPRRPKLSNSPASSRQDDSKDDEVYEDQVLAEHVDIGSAPTRQHKQSNENFFQSAQFEMQPIRFDPEVVKTLQVSAEQANQEQWDDQVSYDDFAMVLDPRLFE